MEIVNRPTNVRECARITGIPYRWLLDQFNGLNPPPHYVRPGCKRPEVIPAEIMEWYRNGCKEATK